MVEAGETLKIRNIDWRGTPHIPVFSSVGQLQRAIRNEVSYVALNAIKLMEITHGTPLVLNPGAAYGKEFTTSEIRSILNGSIGRPEERLVVEKKTDVMLGQPSNNPSELVEALQAHFKRNRAVKKAYLAHFFNPAQDEKPHTLIGLEVAGDWDSAIKEVGAVIAGVPVPDPPVDFIQLTGKSGVDDYLRSTKPFYEKKLFGMF